MFSVSINLTRIGLTTSQITMMARITWAISSLNLEKDCPIWIFRVHDLSSVGIHWIGHPDHQKLGCLVHNEYGGCPSLAFGLLLRGPSLNWNVWYDGQQHR